MRANARYNYCELDNDTTGDTTRKTKRTIVITDLAGDVELLSLS
jgi:hypothetical protein